MCEQNRAAYAIHCGSRPGETVRRGRAKVWVTDVRYCRSRTDDSVGRGRAILMKPQKNSSRIMMIQLLFSVITLFSVLAYIRRLRCICLPASARMSVKCGYVSLHQTCSASFYTRPPMLVMPPMPCGAPFVAADSTSSIS